MWFRTLPHRILLGVCLVLAPRRTVTTIVRTYLKALTVGENHAAN